MTKVELEKKVKILELEKQVLELKLQIAQSEKSSTICFLPHYPCTRPHYPYPYSPTPYWYTTTTGNTIGLNLENTNWSTATLVDPCTYTATDTKSLGDCKVKTKFN